MPNKKNIVLNAACYSLTLVCKSINRPVVKGQQYSPASPQLLGINSEPHAEWPRNPIWHSAMIGLVETVHSTFF